MYKYVASWIRFVRVSTASSASSGLWSETLQRICAIMWDLKSLQFVRGETRVGGRGLCSMWVLRVTIIGVWSEERSPLLYLYMGGGNAFKDKKVKEVRESVWV